MKIACDCGNTITTNLDRVECRRCGREYTLEALLRTYGWLMFDAGVAEHKSDHIKRRCKMAEAAAVFQGIKSRIKTLL